MRKPPLHRVVREQFHRLLSQRRLCAATQNQQSAGGDGSQASSQSDQGALNAGVGELLLCGRSRSGLLCGGSSLGGCSCRGVGGLSLGDSLRILTADRAGGRLLAGGLGIRGVDRALGRALGVIARSRSRSSLVRGTRAGAVAIRDCGGAAGAQQSV